MKVPFFAMVNLIAEEEVVPELVQNNFTAENVVAVDEIWQMAPPGADAGWSARVKVRAGGGTRRCIRRGRRNDTEADAGEH